MTEEILTPKQVVNLVESNRIRCGCGHRFSEDDIRTYPHSGGYNVKDYTMKQWVYFHCRGCGYNLALWKAVGQIKKDRLMVK